MVSLCSGRSTRLTRMLLVPILLGSLLLLQPVQAADEKPNNIDPFEPINRPLYKFNDLTDRFILRPLGTGYNAILPQPARNGVGNFYDNITYPVTIVNSLLQGKFRQSGSDLLRLLMNSTVGILGFMDVATGQGLPRHDEDFGQTFAKWGIPQGASVDLTARKIAVIGEPLQHDLQRAAGFPGPQQADVEAAEYRALFLHGIGQCRSFLDALPNIAEHFRQRFIVGKRYENGQCPVERQACLQQGAQLARGIADLLFTDSPPAQADVAFGSVVAGGLIHANRDMTQGL